MSAPIQTLGYRSRTAAVVALLADGETFEAIAARIGITVKQAMDLDTSSRRVRPSRPAERDARTVVVPKDVLSRLKPAADTRGISVNALVRDILDTVAAEQLVDAILDDAGDQP